MRSRLPSRHTSASRAPRSLAGRPPPPLVAVAVLLLAAHAPLARCVKINISVEECFTEYIKEAGTVVAGSFVAIPPKGLTATQREYDLTITDPDGRVVYQVLEKIEEKFSIVASRVGQYKLCLATSEYRKQQRRWHSYRQVFWEVEVGHTVHHDKVTGGEFEALWGTVERLDRALQELRSSQAYLKNREARHRMTVDSTNWRVQFFAVLRALGLIAVCVTQVLVIRRMFSGPLSGSKGGVPAYYF